MARVVYAVTGDDGSSAIDALDGKGKADAGVGSTDVIQGGLGEAVPKKLASPIIIQFDRLEESKVPSVN